MIPRPQKIIFLLGALVPGGAEVFVVKLAKAFKRNGYYVELFLTEPHPTKTVLWSDLESSNIPIKYYQLPVIINFLAWKFNAVASKLGFFCLYGAVFKRFQYSWFRKHVSQMGKVILNSHSFKSDCFLGSLQLPYFLTIHGEYDFLLNAQNDNDILLSQSKIENNFKNSLKIILVARKYLKFQPLLPFIDKVCWINAGTEKPLNQKEAMSNISKPCFRFVMVARGIKEKGWEIAIEAFLRTQAVGNVDRISLSLIYTDTEFMRLLRSKYAMVENLIFYGYSENVVELLPEYDCLILPSFSECCPLVVAEAMSVGLPVIATDVGEISAMLGIDNGKSSGLVVSYSKNHDDVIYMFSEAMIKLISNSELRSSFRKNALRNFELFDINSIALRYQQLFEITGRIGSHN